MSQNDDRDQKEYLGLVAVSNQSLEESTCLFSQKTES